MTTSNEREGPRGLLISLEGVDGTGKSTQASRLVEQLRHAGHAVCAVREPGGTALGEAVRELVLHRELEPAPVAWAESLVLVAARAQLVAQVIAPALARAEIVVADRFVDSTLAYQGGGSGVSMAALRRLHAEACGDVWPDLTLLLTVDPAVAAARRAGVGAELDRIERAVTTRRTAIADAFDAIAGAEPARVVRVDASASADSVALAVRDAVERRLGVSMDPPATV